MTRTHYKILALLFCFGFGLWSSLSVPAWSQPSQQRSRALELVQAAQSFYQAGEFDQAAVRWQEAANVYEGMGAEKERAKSLINQAQALQELGLMPKACNTLLAAFGTQAAECSSEQIEQLLKILSAEADSLAQFQGVGLRSLGDVLRRQGQLAASQSVLQLSLAVTEGSPEASATWLSLGNTEQALGHQKRDRWDYEDITAIIDQKTLATALEIYEPAFQNYQKAASESASSLLPPVQAQLNQFQLLREIEQWWLTETNRRIASWSRQGESRLIERAEDFLSALQLRLSNERSTLSPKIASQLTRLPASPAATYARINFAQSLMALEQTDQAEPVLQRAQQEARTSADQRSESYALGYLAQVSAQRGELTEATNLTRQALMLAQEQNINGDAREIAYLWQSQLGSLLKQQGEVEGAIAAYGAAFNTLQSLRNDLNANASAVQFDFLREVKPVYVALADLLLQSDLNGEDLNSLLLSNPSLVPEKGITKTPNNRLALARRVMESLQLAELDNFFQDPCSQEAEVAVEIDDLDAEAAVIYPFILRDRLELIIALPGQPLRQTAVPIRESEVNDTLDQLYDYLDNPTVNNSARNILSTSNPNPQELKENLEKTLPLLSQLYDWLIEPWQAELANPDIKHLVFVLNGRLQKLPVAALYDGKQYLVEQYGISLAPSLQLINPQTLSQEDIKVLAAGVSEQVTVGDQIFPPLVNVPNELAQIKGAFPASQKFLNADFTAETIQTQLQADFPVVHLATHGLFSSDPENSFIVTGDGNKIGMSELSTLLQAGEANELQLLVLSACETATGDERAVLGLAGVAVRSGARSTLATLWAVEDASAAEVMGQFYQQLKQGKPKLDALRTAQLKLVNSLQANPPFEELQSLPPHPYYWAPYVLVGNWQ